MILFLATASAGLPRCAEAPDTEASAELDAWFRAAREATDEKAMKAVLKLHKKGRICTAEDHFKAGFVLVPSRDADTLEIAYTLGVVAANHHVDRGKWLTITAFDRWQLAQGNPQRYGTQIGPQGACIYKIDESIGDDVREGWGAPTLRATYASFLENRGMAGKSPTATTLNSLGLFCPDGAW